MNNSYFDTDALCFGWFISPHGFGHAARAAAVMDAVHDMNPSVRFEIFTTVPEFFFKESLEKGIFNYHSLVTDIGLAQKNSLDVDLPETLRKLDDFLPFKENKIADLAALVKELNCRAIVCEIAPMGIAVARAANIPSLLVENFTWDWIYGEYQVDNPGMTPHIHYLRDLFDAVDYHIRTEPAFHYEQRHCHLLTPPMSRKVRTEPPVTRKKLNIPGKAKVVTITMGGVPGQLPFLRQLVQYRYMEGEIRFIIPGSSSFSYEDNLILLPYNSGFYHPDLVHASDVVIGKPGYSTVAEVYQTGIPFGYISRGNFRESAVMEAFIKKEMSGFAIMETEFHEGTWLSRLPELLEMPRIQRSGVNGAVQAAHFLLDLLPVAC